MQKQLLPEAEGYARTNVRRRIWRRFVRVMACIVVFCTTYALILPAITLEREGVCEMEEHTHSDACYSLQTAQEVARLSCTRDSLQIHTHTRDCYGADNELLCGFADFVVHEHSGACFDAAGNLVCTLPVVREHEHTDECYEPAHVHTEDCYIPEGELICELEEIEAHSHDETCTEAVLVCELTVEPHEHTDGCYEQLVCQLPEDENHTHDDSCSGLVLVCGLTEQPHTHGESCYETEYVCGLEETEGHTHEESCYASEETLICEEEEAAEGEDPRGELICEREEIVLHIHGDDCYEVTKDAEGNEIRTLICQELEIREHVHDESCFVTETVELDTQTLTCTETDETHEHTDRCYGTWVLTCELEEHTHTEECYPETEYYCGLEEHTHNEECTDEEGNLICDLDEHTHEEVCTVETVIMYCCGYEEHTHAEECTDEEGNLICELDEHIHSDACITYYCGLNEHTHSEMCVDEHGHLVCYSIEHIHSGECLQHQEHVSPEIQWHTHITAGTPNAAGLMMFKSNTPIDPLSAWINQQSTTQQDPWKDLNLDKYVIDNGDGTFTLRLETYVTGSDGTLTSTPVPTDIVLVLDESGSMNDCIDCGHEMLKYNSRYSECTPLPDKIEDGYVIRAQKVFPNSIDTSRYYQIVYKDNTTRVIDYCEKCKAWYSAGSAHFGENATHTGWAKWTPFETANQTPSYNDKVEHVVQFYCYCQHEKSRNEVLISVATNFINEVYEDSKGEDNIIGTADDVTHRIAIVGYGDNDNSRIYSIDGTAIATSDANTKDAFRDVRNDSEKSVLLTGLNSIRKQYATATNQGMLGAEMILRNNPLATGELRNRVVILFTDGSPGSGYYNDRGWANGAIDSSYRIKNTYETTVYCVGLYPGADGGNPGNLPPYLDDEIGVNNPKFYANGNRFLHLVSSNYKQAKSLDDTGSLAGLTSGQSYYLSAEDEAGLSNIFGQLAAVVTPGQTSITALDEKTVVRDIVTDYFTIPDASKVTAWSESYLGLADDGVTKVFARKADDVSLTPVVSGNNVDVAGFNYSQHFVHMEKDESGNNIPKGKRVVLEVPIVPASDNHGGIKQPTNVTGKTGTAVYYEGTYLKPYPLPYVDVPTTVRVEKRVTGNVSNPTLQFDFTADYMKLNGYCDVELTTYGDSNYLEAIKQAVENDSFKLGHQEIEILKDIYVGSTLTVTETLLPGYTTTVMVNGVEIYPDADGRITVTVEPGMEIIFFNYAGYELPATGGAGTYLYTMGGALLTCAAILLYIHNLKRRKEERPSF